MENNSNDEKLALRENSSSLSSNKVSEKNSFKLINKKTSIDFDYNRIDPEDINRPILQNRMPPKTLTQIEEKETEAKRVSFYSREANVTNKTLGGKKYGEIVRMMGTIKSDKISADKNNSGEIMIPTGGSIPLNSLLKGFEKQQIKEQENTNLVDKLINKLNDFQKDMEDIKISEEGENLTKSKEKAEKKPQLVNLLPQRSMNVKTIQERVFWSKEKLHRIREKFRFARQLIERKTETEFSEIKINIEKGDTQEVLYYNL
jgi:hypothetical protein